MNDVLEKGRTAMQMTVYQQEYLDYAHFYNIHGILDVESPVPLSELSSFEAVKTNCADLVIEPLSSKQRSVGSRKISVGNGSATYSEHLDSLGAKVHIDFSGNPIHVQVSKLLFKSPHVLYVNIVEPLLRLLLASKGYVLLHSACLSKDGRGYLISAPPDTGKTTTVLRCIKESGFEFVSDDMTIMDQFGNLYDFPKPLTISAHTFSALCSNRNGPAARIPSLRIRGYAHSRMGRRILRSLGRLMVVPILTLNAVAQILVKPPKVKITEVIGDVGMARRAKLRAFFFLAKGRSEIREIPLKQALSRAILNSDDAFLFPPYHRIFPHVRLNGFTFKGLMIRERQILSKVLSNCRIYVLYSENRGWSESLLKMT